MNDADKGGNDEEWQRSIRFAKEGYRFDVGLMRIALSVLIPLGLYLYSPVLGTMAAVPFGIVFTYLLASAWRRFVKRGQLFWQRRITVRGTVMVPCRVVRMASAHLSVRWSSQDSVDSS